MMENKDMEELKETYIEIRLGDIAYFQKGFAFKSKDFEDVGRKIVKVSNLTDQSIDINSCVCLAEKLAEKYEKYSLNLDDIIITTVGSWPTNPASVVGKVIKVPKKAETALLNQNAVRIRANEKITQKYLYYALKYEKFKNYIINTAQGSASQASITQEDIKNYLINLPPLETQEKIASILSALDDKIEINNEMNKTLEEMAQTLFKRWFIDFDFPNENGEPYRSSGGKMVDSELGEIPEGWGIGVFREFIKETIGGDWGKEVPQGNYIEEVFCIRGADIIDSTKGNFEKVPKRFILNKNFQNKKLIFGDMIVEISGGSPTQSTGRIGYINKIILENFKEKLITTNFCRIMRPYNLEETAFIYDYWKFLYDMTMFFQFENGTTGIKNLDLNGFLDSYTIVRPSSERIKEYTQIVDKFNILIQENGKEIKNLTQIRDTLLPKLMSGEIEV